MSPRRPSVAVRVGLAGLVVVLASCASAPTSPAMQAKAPAVAAVTAPGAVVVAVSGGQATSALDGPNLADADFRSAIAASLTQARAFESVAERPGARFALRAHVVRLAKPLWGGTFTVDLEVGWTLVDQTQGEKVLLRKSIASSGTATMADAFVGATRIRLAVEAAARANIELLLRELATVAY